MPTDFLRIFKVSLLSFFFRRYLATKKALLVPPPKPANGGIFLLTIILYLTFGSIIFSSLKIFRVLVTVLLFWFIMFLKGPMNLILSFFFDLVINISS